MRGVHVLDYRSMRYDYRNKSLWNSTGRRRQEKKWCKEHNQRLNEGKTKEMVFDPLSIGDHSPVLINGERFEQVTTCRYLGIHFDSQLQLAQHVCVYVLHSIRNPS